MSADFQAQIFLPFSITPQAKTPQEDVSAVLAMIYLLYFTQ